jgi:hypothetical protein
MMDGGEERLSGKRSRSSTQSSVHSLDLDETPMTLPDRFAELMLVVGIDDNTGLVPLGGQQLDVSKTKIQCGNSSLFHLIFSRYDLGKSSEAHERERELMYGVYEAFCHWLCGQLLSSFFYGQAST